MDTHGYSAHILVNGRKVKEYRHNGLTFIEAKNGTEFSIEVKNHLSSRVLAVVSVDGLDIIDGQPASDKSRGYVIEGYSSQKLTGWRKSDTEVGAFKFVTGEQSYATEKGQGQNNGVIAVKLFAEKAPEYHPRIDWNPVPRPKTYPQPYYLDTTGNAQHLYRAGGATCRSLSLDASAVAPVAQSYSVQTDSLEDSKSAFDMGTTWGSLREERVTTTEFKRGQEIATLEVYYASRNALQEMGIPLVSETFISGLPQAFPAKYAQPPKNWRA